MIRRVEVLREPGYRRFILGYGLSYVLYWVTLLSVGWWMWETTGSAAWVGLVYFCDLIPSLFVTPFAAAVADRGDRVRQLRAVLWLQVATGFALSVTAAAGLLSPPLLAGFALAEGVLVGFGQPAFFGLLNRIVSPANLSAAVGINVSVVQASYIAGPLLAGLLFGWGLSVAPIAFAANAVGTLGYLWCLGGVALRDAPPRAEVRPGGLRQEIVAGLTVFWTDRTAFRATVPVLAVAIIQRPLISLMTAVNERYALFSASRFTLLTAALMAGGLVAGLIHARRNSDAGQERATLRVFSALAVWFVLLFLGLDVVPAAAPLAMAGFFLVGLGCSYVVAGSSVILQNRTAEDMRSRVLGNNLMLARASGAVSVLAVGLLADRFGLEAALIASAGASAAIVVAATRRFRGAIG